MYPFFSASDVLAFILENLGEPKSNEFGFSVVNESDGLFVGCNVEINCL